MYYHQGPLVEALKKLHANRGPERTGSRDSAVGAVGAGAGFAGDAFKAIRDQKRKQQLQAAAAKLKEDKRSTEEYGQAMGDFYGKGTEESAEAANKAFGEAYLKAANAEYTKQLGNQLDTQLATHDAADRSSPEFKQAQQNYAEVNGQDQFKARNMVRQGMGMSSIGINPEVGY